jgi:excisionase family DNA binding protein
MTTEGGEFALNQTGCDEVLTIREAAGFLKLSDQHVRRLAEAGELPGRKLGDRWRFSRQALLRHLEGDADRHRDRDGGREQAPTESS